MSPAFLRELQETLEERDIGLDLVRGPMRHREIVAARYAVIRLCDRHGMRINAIADFVFRNHRTVGYALRDSPSAKSQLAPNVSFS